MLAQRSIFALILVVVFVLAAVSSAFAIDDRGGPPSPQPSFGAAQDASPALWGEREKDDAAKQTKPAAVKSAAKSDFLFPDTKDSKEAPKEQPAYVTALGFISKLALVLLLAYCTIYVLKRFTGTTGAMGQGRQRIRVIENAGLAANRSLHLVEVGSRNYLVASTPNSVSLIAEIDPADLPEVPEAEQQSSFGQQLTQFLGQRADSGRAAQSVAEMLRESSTYLQDKVREVGGIRRKHRDA